MEGQRREKLSVQIPAHLLLAGTTAAHILDLEINLHATNKELVFEEFKDGFVGIRTHPDLRLNPSPKHGVNKVFGNARNSEGIEGKEIWGKRADWVHYHGTVKGKAAGIAFMSHPSNLTRKEKNHGGMPVTTD